MSFDYTSLITDRAVSDSDTLKALLGKPMAEWTEEELTAFNRAVMKGSYDYTDLNRVDDCLEDLVARLGRVGCNVPGYERLKIERTVTPSSRLPDGYTEVQYIQSSGTQYIDTGFKPNQNSRITLRLAHTDTAAASYLFSASEANPFFGLCYVGGYYAEYGSMQKQFSADLSTVTTIDVSNSVFVVGSQSFATAVADFTAPSNLFLCCGNNGGSPNFHASLKLYSCQIYDNGALVCDFVPCINSSGAVGLYDLVGQKFYDNAGSGSFTAGPSVTWDTPEEPPEELDPYTWYESDVPVPSQMARYRANVAAVRGALALPEGTPAVPSTMRQLTPAAANSIEAVLLTLDMILNNLPAAVRHCGVTVCGSKGVIA